MYPHLVSEIALEQVDFRSRLLHECGANEFVFVLVLGSTFFWWYAGF